jgi:hypothetical protein
LVGAATGHFFHFFA